MIAIRKQYYNNRSISKVKYEFAIQCKFNVGGKTFTDVPVIGDGELLFTLDGIVDDESIVNMVREKFANYFMNVLKNNPIKNSIK